MIQQYGRIAKDKSKAKCYNENNNKYQGKSK